MYFLVVLYIAVDYINLIIRFIAITMMGGCQVKINNDTPFFVSSPVYNISVRSESVVCYYV